MKKLKSFYLKHLDLCIAGIWTIVWFGLFLLVKSESNLDLSDEAFRLWSYLDKAKFLCGFLYGLCLSTMVRFLVLLPTSKCLDKLFDKLFPKRKKSGCADND